MSGRESAAEIVRRHLEDVEQLIARGKGEWGEPGYVRDERWASWHGERAVLRTVLREIEGEAP